MICKECQEESKKSKIYEVNSIITRSLIAWSSYYDEEGKYHSHNPNSSTEHYRCSNGHEWNIITKVKWDCGCENKDNL